MIKHMLIAGLAASSLLAGSAFAVPIQITAISGEWTATTPSSPDVTGQGTNLIQWGDPAVSGGDQSGYQFDGAVTPFAVTEEVTFNLGTFTHFNNPIFAPSLETARLTVDSTVDIGGTVGIVSSVFDFLHLETPNTDDPCADGGANGSGINDEGCADRVTFALNVGASDSFSIGGVNYFIDISGFFYNGALADEFWTREGEANEATLRGIVTSEVASVPEPSAVALMGLGLLGLGFRRKLKKVA